MTAPGRPAGGARTAPLACPAAPRSDLAPLRHRLRRVHQLPPGLRGELDRRLRFSTAAVASERAGRRRDDPQAALRPGRRPDRRDGGHGEPARGGSGRRATVCVSTQVGCAIGCPFCATGRMGLRRSCTPAEVVDQVRLAGQALSRRALGPVTHVVYMGMGEPLAAYETTVASLRVLVAAGRNQPAADHGLHQRGGAGHPRLATEGLPVTLAVSLHAASDALRDRLVPLNRAHPLDGLVAAAGAYARATGSPPQPGVVPHRRSQRRPRPGRRAGRHRPEARRPRQRHPHEPDRGQPLGAAPCGRRAGLPAPSHRRGGHRDRRDTRGGEAEAACGQLRAALEPRRQLRPDGTLSPPRPQRPVRRGAPIRAENGSRPGRAWRPPPSGGPAGPLRRPACSRCGCSGCRGSS